MVQKGFAVIPFLVIIAILSASIIGGSLYIKTAHPELIQKQTVPQSTTQIQQSTVVSNSTSTIPVTKTAESTTERTYINKKYSYSTVFPTEWIFNKSDDTVDTAIITLPKGLNYNSENFGTNLLIRVYVDDTSTYPVKTQA